MSASGPSGPLVSVNYVPHRGLYGHPRGLQLTLEGVNTRTSMEAYILLNMKEFRTMILISNITKHIINISKKYIMKQLKLDNLIQNC